MNSKTHLRSMQAEGRKFVSCKKCVCLLATKFCTSLVKMAKFYIWKIEDLLNYQIY